MDDDEIINLDNQKAIVFKLSRVILENSIDQDLMLKIKLKIQEEIDSGNNKFAHRSYMFKLTFEDNKIIISCRENLADAQIIRREVNNIDPLFQNIIATLYSNSGSYCFYWPYNTNPII